MGNKDNGSTEAASPAGQTDRQEQTTYYWLNLASGVRPVLVVEFSSPPF